MTEDARGVAVGLLHAAAMKAKRKETVAFPPSFMTSQGERRSSLARLVHGGRGGEVRLKLYLCISMMATSDPYDLKAAPTPRGWARLLAMPTDSGARRVNSNIKWLEREKYIRLQRRVANTPIITLLDASGSGGKYQRPIHEGRYVGVPIELWTKGWIVDLPTTALALLLVLLENQGGYDGARYVTRYKREMYGLSPDTWTRARKVLEEFELLTVTRVPQGSDFDYRRLRNSFWINVGRLKSESNPLARRKTE